MQVVIHTSDLQLLALLVAVLKEEGFGVSWNRGEGYPIAGLDLLEKGQAVVWFTPLGLRAYSFEAMAFLTRRDDPKTLPGGLLGNRGLGLSERERELLLALGRLGTLSAKPLARALGASPEGVRFFLRRLRHKFALEDPLLLRLARRQVEAWEAQRALALESA